MGALILISPLRAPEPTPSLSWLPDKTDAERQVIVDNLLPSLCVPLGGRRTGNLVHFRMCLPVSLLQPLHARDVDVAGGVREVRRILDLWH